ncbi:hypothetical protein Csa_014062 [Cucumis sativus]|nr:hypothetical protein Csa_014062 [Cucumis sativus]
MAMEAPTNILIHPSLSAPISPSHQTLLTSLHLLNASAFDPPTPNTFPPPPLDAPPPAQSSTKSNPSPSPSSSLSSPSTPLPPPTSRRSPISVGNRSAPVQIVAIVIATTIIFIGALVGGFCYLRRRVLQNPPLVASEVVNLIMSRELWLALEELYGATSKSPYKSIGIILQNTRKGTMRMTEYLSMMKQTLENMQLAGSPISHEDLFSYVLVGLDVEYIPIVCDIEGKNSPTWHDV